jgi:hypothetical protein
LDAVISGLHFLLHGPHFWTAFETAANVAFTAAWRGIAQRSSAFCSALPRRQNGPGISPGDGAARVDETEPAIC